MNFYNILKTGHNLQSNMELFAYYECLNTKKASLAMLF